MSLNSSRVVGYDRFLVPDSYLLPGVDPERIEWEAIPDNFRYYDKYLDEQDRRHTRSETLINVFSLIPYLGNLAKSVIDPVLAGNRRYLQQQRADLNSRYANWYNSPAQQMKRLRRAGINPYIQGASSVRTVPAEVPSVQPYPSYPSSSFDPNSFARLLQNQPLVNARIENLESLSDINQYKYEYLLPQLFDRNGYVNNILELQSAWETGNYDYERQLKQNMLNTSYMVSVAALGEQIMNLQPQIDGVRTIVDVNTGTINYIAEDGTVVNPSEMSFNQLPLFMQDAFVDIYSKQSNISLNYARERLMSSQENQYNAMAALYNANREKIQIDVDSYRRTGVWSTEDFTLRFAAGLLNDQTYWKNFGLNTINNLQDAAIDVGSAWLNPRTLLKQQNMSVPSSVPYVPNVQPQPLNIPKGARPFTVNGKVYYYQK